MRCHIYLRASTEGAERIGLNGEPVGIVSADEARWAQVRRKAIIAKRNAVHREHVRSTIEVLAQTFPKAFFIYEKRRRPLKDNVCIDILPRVEDTIAGPELRRAVDHYCGNAAYLRTLVKGTPKIDLQGRPAGTVTAAEEVVAKEVLARREQAKGSREVDTAPPGPITESQPTKFIPTKQSTPSTSPQGPQRLGLADLKRAAQARQAAKQAAE